MKNGEITTAHVLIFQGGSVLLVRHGENAGHITGTYGVPGGRIDGQETLKQAAMREVEEETGLEVMEEDLYEYPGNDYTADILRKDGTIKRVTAHVFVAKKFYGGLKAVQEIIPEWIEIAQLHTYQLLPNVEKMIVDGWELQKTL